MVGAGVHIVDMNSINLACVISVMHKLTTAQGTHAQPLHQSGIPQTGIFVVAEGIILPSRLVTRDINLSANTLTV